jgi:hypothetical protein
MVWVKLADDFPEHPKFGLMGDLAPVAGWLHVCAICYCNRHLTDGFIPFGKVWTLASFRHLGIETGGIKDMAGFGHDIESEELVELLVDVGLWEVVTNGYQIHDYLEFQPSRAEWEAEQEQKRQAGRLGGLAAAKARAKAAAKASAIAPPIAESKPVPVPVPGSFSKKKEEEKRKLQAVETPGADRAPSKSEPTALGTIIAAMGVQP